MLAELGVPFRIRGTAVAGILIKPVPVLSPIPLARLLGTAGAAVAGKLAAPPTRMLSFVWGRMGNDKGTVTVPFRTIVLSLNSTTLALTTGGDRELCFFEHDERTDGNDRVEALGE